MASMNWNAFVSWCRRCNKVISKILPQSLKILYRKFPPWQISSANELASHVQLYVFSDASFASESGEGSMESYMLILGRPHSRNGDVLCVGSYVGGGARRIARVRRSSLSSEAIAASNSADTGLFVRVLLIEIILGRFEREIVDPIRHFKLMTPFGLSPRVDTVLSEMHRTEKEPPVFDLRNSSGLSESLQRDLFDNRMMGGSLSYICRMLLLTDSANVYASLLCGKGPSAEKSVRIQISYLRDMSDVMALTFIGHIYNFG